MFYFVETTCRVTKENRADIWTLSFVVVPRARDRWGLRAVYFSSFFPIPNFISHKMSDLGPTKLVPKIWLSNGGFVCNPVATFQNQLPITSAKAAAVALRTRSLVASWLQPRPPFEHAIRKRLPIFCNLPSRVSPDLVLPFPGASRLAHETQENYEEQFIDAGQGSATIDFQLFIAEQKKIRSGNFKSNRMFVHQFSSTRCWKGGNYTCLSFFCALIIMNLH